MMGETYKTGCVLCAQNCGLEVEVENNQIVKVKPDKSNAKSEGYACRKGLNITYHQHNADRLKYPLKRVGDRFERISWDQAIDEIGLKRKGIIDRSEIIRLYGRRRSRVPFRGGFRRAAHAESGLPVPLQRLGSGICR
jgi:anaerobic selenocysteine-containing dehydrogenase